MTQLYIQIGIVSLFWGGWPLILRSAGDVGNTGAFLLSASALIPLSLFAFSTGFTLPETNSLMKLLIAGIIMGAGMIIYNNIINGGLIEISTFVPIANTLMLLITTIGGIVFFAESFTLQKIIGFIFMLIGIFLLRPTG